MIKILDPTRASKLEVEININYEANKPKKIGNINKLEFKDFSYKEKELNIINNTIIDKDDMDKINRLKEVTLKTKYVYVYEDIYKLFKNNYSPAEIAEVYGKTSRTLQHILKKAGLSRDRWEAQAIAKTKRDYKEIQLKGRKTMNENLTMLNGSSYEQYTRNLLSFDLALRFKELESIVGVNNKSILKSGNEIDIPIIIIGDRKMLKLAIEYDGDFWHKDNSRDINKEKLIEDKGYKLFRIAPKPLATEKQIKDEIKIVLDNIYDYISDFFK